ncbi:MAG: Asp-tRNA(Asn)/Glu-tRNA(Gln) amidotransferase subunit GatB [Bacteroidetes bacterium]|nr:Asp-tRNA(Asn)/Glu-tRNA(Gln) amidotransferase subunit GatB [Bacteroidota bacterium]
MTDTSKHEPVIGLEIHAQLSTNTKAFSNDSAEFGGTPNSNISAITLGHPGTLPKLNFKIIDYAIKMGLALNCTINKLNRFARKNYFYADLPKGYQISQFETPICSDGYMKLGVNGEEKKIGITRVHMEEDSGKSNHEQDPYYSLIDLNRAGVPLIEIVSEPDMRSADEAFEFVSEIRRMVRYLDICDGNMEEGSLRCDANVSVRLKGADKFGEKVEVKNMNSIRNVKKAIEYEIQRQIEAIEKGEKITQDTRSFDAAKGVTFTMRSKEMAHDYRYFTEPDLPPVKLTQEHIDKLKKDMPIMPDEHLARLTGELKLDEYDAYYSIDIKEGILFENNFNNYFFFNLRNYGIHDFYIYHSLYIFFK